MRRRVTRRVMLAMLATALPLLGAVAVVVAPQAVHAPRAGATTPFVPPYPAYWLVASDGGVFSFGGAPYFGGTGGMVLNNPVVGMAATPLDEEGYWLVASDGGIFSYGDAQFYGSTGSLALNSPVVGMAPTPDGGGYWLVAADGGIFAFGDAHFYGSTGGMALNKPVVGMAATPDGGGYWLVASDGGIFSFGDAQFYGSTGSLALNKPIIGMLTGPGGAGYFLVASDGGIFSFGSAPFYGSLGSVPLKNPIVGATAINDGSGYWFTDSAGVVSNFGAARYYGSAPPTLFRPIVGMADAPGSTSVVGGTYPSGAYGYDVSTYQCGNLPTGDHTISIVEVDGASSSYPNGCLLSEAQWAGAGLNLYTFLTYATSASGPPICNGDQACNAGYNAGIHAYQDAQNLGVNPNVPWWLDVETTGNWSGNPAENAALVQGALDALHETEGVGNVGIYASPGVWNSIVGNYQPDVPYWMADWLSPPSGPASCSDYYSRWQSSARLPTGPLEIVQYTSAQFDQDYAC